MNRIRTILTLVCICWVSALSAQESPITIPDSVQQTEQARIDAIAKGSRCTIGVFGPQSQGGGSGVVISADGYALSNYHVVEGAGSFMKLSLIHI